MSLEINDNHSRFIEFPDYTQLSLHTTTIAVIREKILNEYRKYKCGIPRIKDYRFKKLFQNIKDIDSKRLVRVSHHGGTLHHNIIDDINTDEIIKRITISTN